MRIIICLFLVGCSAVPQIEYNKPESIQLEKIELSNIQPIAVPNKPIVPIVTTPNGKVAQFNAEQMTTLNQMYLAAKTNEELVNKLNLANNHVVVSYNAMVDIVQLQERKINIVERELTRTENQRRSENFWAGIWQAVDKAIIAVLVFANLGI